MSRPRLGPFAHGLALGVAMPGLMLLLLAGFGNLRPWLQQGAAYGLMLLFAAQLIPAYFATRRLRPRYLDQGQRALHLTHGIFLGAWVVGACLLWAAQPGSVSLSRVTSSLTGSVMLVAFWPWAGSIVAHYEPRSGSGSSQQSQELSSRPR